jgi:hypothetical protein
MARRRSRELSDADFASAVVELYKAAVRGDVENFSAGKGREVREVAFSLAIIRQLLDRELEGATIDLPGKPILGALAIIDALTSGRDHPIWWHIAGLKSESFRTQNAPPSRIEELGRVIAVGLVRAYQQTANVSRREAIRAVVATCRFEDFTLREEQIKRWDRTFREQQEPGPDAFAKKFFDDARTLAEAIRAGDDRTKGCEWFGALDAADRVLTIGRTCFYRAWGVPGAKSNV